MEKSRRKRKKFTCWAVNKNEQEARANYFSVTQSLKRISCCVVSVKGTTQHDVVFLALGVTLKIIFYGGSLKIAVRLSDGLVLFCYLVGGSGVVVSLIVHRFYLTKKKVYLLVGKLQRSREKIKPFRQPLAVWVLLLGAAVAALVQV